MRTAGGGRPRAPTGVGARVDHDQLRRVRAAAAVEHPHPEHRLGLGDVVAPQGDRVAVVDVGVAARLAVGAEARLQRRGGGGGAEPGVAVHVRRADARPSRSRRGCSTPRGRAGRWCRSRIDPSRPGSSSSSFERSTIRPMAVSQSVSRAGRPSRTSGRVEPVGLIVGLPAVEVLGIEPAAVDAVDRPAPDADDAAVLDGDVHARRRWSAGPRPTAPSGPRPLRRVRRRGTGRRGRARSAPVHMACACPMVRRSDRSS